jgi:hypothetical protein
MKQWTRLPEQDSKEDSYDRTRDRTTVTGQLAKNIWERTTRTGQPGQVGLDRLAWTGPRGQECQDMTASPREL